MEIPFINQFQQKFGFYQKRKHHSQPSIKRVFIKRKKEYTLVALGDSIVVGEGTEKGSYVKKYGRLLKQQSQSKVSIYDYGKNGYTSTEVVRTLQSQKTKETIIRADIIFVNIGGNDVVKEVAKNGVSFRMLQSIEMIRQRYIQNLHTVLKEIRTINKSGIIVVNTMYNPLSLRGFLNSMVSNYMKKWNESIVQTTFEYEPSIVIPVHRVLNHSLQQRWLAEDNFHLNDYGAQVIANEINKRIILESKR